jgi:hypothetical protein
MTTVHRFSSAMILQLIENSESKSAGIQMCDDMCLRLSPGRVSGGH